MDDALLDGILDQLAPVFQVQLAHDVRTVILHRLDAEVQQVRDLASDQPIFHVFDRSQDPLERSAVRPTDPRYAQAVERYAAAWDLQQAAALALERSPAATWVLVDEDPHQRAQLEGLGYTAGAAGSGMPQGRLVLPRPGE